MCRELAAELEGIKLDIVIMEKRMNSRTNFDFEKSTRDTSDGIVRLKKELLKEKEKSRQLEADLLLVVRERNNSKSLI